MKKKYLLNLTVAILLLFFFSSCEEDPPQPNFSATVSTSTGEVSITFTDLSSNSPDLFSWTFEGGYPSTSTEQNPTVTYSSNGTFSVTLAAKNEGGENEIVKYDYINVVRFNNPLFTNMDVTVNDVTKTMSPDSYVQFAQIDNTSVSYTAETSGKTTDGTTIGEELFWDYDVDLTSYSSYNLILTSDYIFFYITNSSNYFTDNNSWSPFYVNWGNSTDQTVDNIVIPSDGVKYRTGYYYANYGMEVRAYYEDHPTSWVYWYIYPHATDYNQYTNLTYPKSIKGQSEKAIDYSSMEPEMLYPVVETGNKTVFDPSAKNLAPSNKK